jgi:hypothetical protein
MTWLNKLKKIMKFLQLDKESKKKQIKKSINFIIFKK